MIPYLLPALTAVPPSGTQPTFRGEPIAKHIKYGTHSKHQPYRISIVPSNKRFLRRGFGTHSGKGGKNAIKIKQRGIIHLITNRINPKPRTEYAPRRQAPAVPGNRPRPARKRCATQQAGHPQNPRSTAGPQARQNAERATAETGLTQNTSRHSPQP